MAVDSEINISVLDPVQATKLRKKIWYQLAGKEVIEAEGRKLDIQLSFEKWVDISIENKNKVLAKKESKKTEKLTGHIVQFEDSRSSNIRLG
jgi:hypothetical protein